MVGIYVIQNTESRKVYVGSSVDVVKRMRFHRSQLRGGSHENSHLHRSWDAHGETAFRFWKAEECASDARIEREQWWLDMFEPFGDRGYNIARSASSSGLGMKHTAETKSKISAANTGRRMSPTHRASALAALRNSAMPADSRKRITDFHTGRKRSDATRLRMSQSRKGKPLSEKALAAIGRQDRKGTANPRSKMSDASVVSARAEYAAGGVSTRDMAAKFGIAPTTMKLLLRGKTWGHIA